jgi:hypothetical protein
MNNINISVERSSPFPIVEAVGSHDELARALRVRYYRTVCPAEIGRTFDPPDLMRNFLIYSRTCKERKWPVVILRPELKRVSWGVVVMLPSRALLDITVNPSKLVDKIYSDIIKCNENDFKSCGFVHIVDHSYHAYQGLTLKAGEILAFHMADRLGRYTGALSNA